MIKKAYLPQNRGFETSFGYYEGAIDYYKHTVGPGRGIVDLHSAVAGGEQSCQPQFNGRLPYPPRTSYDCIAESLNTSAFYHSTTIRSDLCALCVGRIRHL